MGYRYLRYYRHLHSNVDLYLVWYKPYVSTYTELVKKFRCVLLGVQNDDVMRSQSEGVKKFL